jgi:hypothetical protein
MRRWISGDMALQDEHHVVVHRVRRGTFELVERRRRVDSSSAWRMLSDIVNRDVHRGRVG